MLYMAWVVFIEIFFNMDQHGFLIGCFQRKNSVIEMIKMASGWAGSCQKGTPIV